MEISGLIKPDFPVETGSLYPAISVLRSACDVIESADRTPDDVVRKDLISGARKMIQNVVDALAEPEPTPEDDD